MVFKRVLLISIVLAINLTAIQGHGRVIDPVHRGYAWRLDFPVPENWNDMGNFCGGFSTQFSLNDGKCGFCGDNWAAKAPRENENGGLYGTGTIVRTYKAGQEIDVHVQLTASHLGHFEFSVCPLKNKTDRETEECFNSYKLKLSNGQYNFTEVTAPKDYHLKVVLPKDLTCEHCVFRWHYRTGNGWGMCEDGKGRLGCGNQEIFRTCSDIKIV